MSDGTLKREIEPFKRSEYKFDLTKLKRWHGTPPLLHDQDEKDFDAFITALAECIQRADALTASLIYRYGVEQYRMGQLLSQRTKDVRRLGQVCRTESVQHIEDGTRDAVENRKVAARARIVARDDKQGSGDTRGVGVAVAQFEEAIDASLRIDALISQCSQRAANLLRQMSLHQLQINRKFDAEFARYIEVIKFGHQEL